MWKWIKVPKGIALLAFLMPWMTVSCSNNAVISASGFGLAFGKVTTKAQSDMEALTGGSTNPWLILALVVIVAGLALSFLPAAKGKARGLLATSGAALLLIWIGTARYSKSAILAEVAKNSGTRNSANDYAGEAVAAAIRVDWHAGFWLAILALIVAGVMAWLVSTGRDDAVEARIRRTHASSGEPADAVETHDCPTCGKTYLAKTRFCPDDGTALT